jgi:hypothetical protein
VMIQTGAQARRLPDRSPGSLERRNQRKTLLIQQNQGRAQGEPLFLSVATLLPSISRWPRHRAAAQSVAVSGCSISFAGASTRRRSADSVCQTDRRSLVQSDPMSNGRQDIHTHRPRAAVLALVASAARVKVGWPGLDHVGISGDAFRQRSLSIRKSSGGRPQSAVLPQSARALFSRVAGLGFVASPIVSLCLWVAYLPVCHCQVNL